MALGSFAMFGLSRRCEIWLAPELVAHGRQRAVEVRQRLVNTKDEFGVILQRDAAVPSSGSC
jgi:hypothetical protein